MLRTALLLFAFTMTTQVSRVEAQKTAAELLWECTGVGAKNAVEAGAQKLVCLGYISGSFDMLRFISDSLKLKAMCWPDAGASNDQMIRVVVKWIERNPELMHEFARAAVFDAVMEAFSCKSAGPPNSGPQPQPHP